MPNMPKSKLQKVRSETKSKMTHTPTPFQIAYYGDSERPVIKKGSETIATGLTKVNASFIVRACNRDHLFNEMVDWLKKENARCAPLSTHGRELAALLTKVITA